jgi:hypothetical protein
MLRRMKHKLAYVSPHSLRYRFVRSAIKEAKLRKAHACTFYWVYLPVAALHFIMFPLLNVVFWILSRPVAWLAGYRRVGPIIPFDVNADIEAKTYENAHVRIAPWRIVFPLVALAGLVILGQVWFLPEMIALAFLLVGAIIGWIAWQHWASVSEAWEKICPRLEIDEIAPR